VPLFSSLPSTQAGTVASLATCQAKDTLIDTCIDSGMSVFGSQSIPPDPHGAAGPETLIAVTNVQIESVKKTDAAVVFGPTDLATMFGSTAGLFDPKVIYDVHRRRFVLVVLATVADPETGDVYESSILVAVSKSSVPASATSTDWQFLKIDSLVDQLWADYPGLAVDEEAIYITNNMFSTTASETGLKKSLVWIIAKDPFYSGGSPVVNRHDYILKAGDGDYGVYMPAMVRSSSGVAPGVGTFLVKYDGLDGGSPGVEAVSIIQIDSPLNNPTFRHAKVDIGDVEAEIVNFVLAPQKDPLGRGESLDAGDNRALEAVWVKNQLWAATTVRDGAGETSALWIKLNANGVTFPPTLADKGLIEGEDIGARTFTSYLSVDVNSKGVVAFGFSAFSKNIFASAYAAIRDDVSDSAGTVRPAMLVKAGEAPYNINFGGPNRWGDYTAMALDPANEDCFWAFNQYAGLDTFDSSGGQFGSWKTAWARLCSTKSVSPPTPPLCKDLNQVCTNKTQCCNPSDKVCDGRARGLKRCKFCSPQDAACVRTPQCCDGLKCKKGKCKSPKSVKGKCKKGMCM
jgi:hypothetical protein